MNYTKNNTGTIYDNKYFFINLNRFSKMSIMLNRKGLSHQLFFNKHVMILCISIIIRKKDFKLFLPGKQLDLTLLMLY